MTGERLAGRGDDSSRRDTVSIFGWIVVCDQVGYIEWDMREREVWGRMEEEQGIVPFRRVAAFIHIIHDPLSITTLCSMQYPRGGGRSHGHDQPFDVRVSA